jgi:hypothetical protein
VADSSIERLLAWLRSAVERDDSAAQLAGAQRLDRRERDQPAAPAWQQRALLARVEVGAEQLACQLAYVERRALES